LTLKCFCSHYSNEYYGGLWASFNFEGLQKWIENCRYLAKPHGKSDEVPTVASDGETLIEAGNQFSTPFNVEENWYIVE
jgi:hypothetical protein